MHPVTLNPDFNFNFGFVGAGGLVGRRGGGLDCESRVVQYASVTGRAG